VGLTRTSGVGGLEFADWFGLAEPRPRIDRRTPGRHPDDAGPIVHVVDRPVRGVAPCDVLAAWRAAERELAAMPVDSPEWTDLRARVAELRASYHQLYNESLHR
jgi:hypothetical protein